MSKIIDKIRKLSALAERAEGNEAEVAARLAGELMEKHAVSLAQLAEADLLQEDPVGVTAIEVGKSTWAINLAWALASHCNIKVVRWRTNSSQHPSEKDDNGNPIRFTGKYGRPDYKRRTWALGYGHRSDLAVWEYLYSVAKREIEKATRAYRKSENDYGWDVSRTECTQFREGAVEGLDQQLRNMRARQAKKRTASRVDNGTTALALKDRVQRAETEMTKKHPHLRTYSGGVGCSGEGIEAGRNININPALTGSRSGHKKLEG